MTSEYNNELKTCGAGTLFITFVKKLFEKKAARVMLYIVMAVASVLWMRMITEYGGGAGRIWWLYDLLNLPGFALWIAGFAGLISAFRGYGTRGFSRLVICLGSLSWVVKTVVELYGTLETSNLWADFWSRIGMELLETIPVMLAAVGIVLLVGRLFTRGKRSDGQRA